MNRSALPQTRWHARWLAGCVLALFLVPKAQAAGVAPTAAHASAATSFASHIARLPQTFTSQLANRVVPNADGAMGLNRAQYFHARFQTGLHALAFQAVAANDAGMAGHFTRALDYAFARQTPDGAFELQVPPKLQSSQAPLRADLASGTAFFLASAGSGLLALKGSSWFMTAPETAGYRQRLLVLEGAIRQSLRYLEGEAAVLQQADAHAPNRLLFDALAFHALGTYLGEPSAQALGHGFMASALALQHADGYFLEGGGFDSSYNGVALALGLRLALMQPGNAELRRAMQRAAEWQLGRVLPSGEVSMQGNSRVRPGGESFLGREKQFDAAHTVEGLVLAGTVSNDSRFIDAAHRVVRYFRSGKR